MALPETDPHSTNNIEDTEDGEDHRLPSVQQIISSNQGSTHPTQQQGDAAESAHAGHAATSDSAQGSRTVITDPLAGHAGRMGRGGRGHEREKSPTPPKTLHRSTTGKGIAYSDEDVTFLVKYLSYRR